MKWHPGKRRKSIDDMTSAEMEALYNRAVKRILWLNGLWILLVLVMLFWVPIIGVILLIITGIKYLYDYHDVESQEHHVGFLKHSLLKRSKERGD